MKTICEFLEYWWANVKTAKHNYEVLAVVIMALIGAGAFIADYVGLGSRSLNPEFLHVLEAVSTAFFTVWGFLWLPFSRHKAQEATSTATINQLKTRINELTNQEAKLEREKKEREVRKQCLAACVEALHARSVEVQKMNYVKYCGAARKEDAATLKLIDDLCGILKEQFGDDVVTLFRRAKSTPLSGTLHSDAEICWEQHLCLIGGKMEQLKSIISKQL